MSTADDIPPVLTPRTIYYVVALQSTRPENIVPCVYFNALWERVESNNLVTDANSDWIRFVDCGTQLPPAVIPELKNRWLPEPDFDVSLFAAVAKTFEPNHRLENAFTACLDGIGQRYIDIPVARGTKRGVVLVFRRFSGDATVRLIATADPEIRNGSG